jgi:hypothetical protein
MWLFTVFTETMSSSAISPPLSKDGSKASTTSSRSLSTGAVSAWTASRARTYADLNERDHRALLDAIADGRVEAQSGM